MLVHRLKENPLITPADVPPSRDDYEVVGAFNPGVTRFNDEVLLLLRVAERPRNRPVDQQVAPVLNPETGKLALFRVNNDEYDLRAGFPPVYVQGPDVPDEYLTCGWPAAPMAACTSD